MLKSGRFIRLTKFLLAAALVASASGCQLLLPREEEPLAPPLVQPKDIDYTTIDVARGDMQETIQGVGRVESVKMVDLSYQQSGGRLKSIDVKIGDKVKKGDVVARLDTADLDYRISVEKLRLQQLQNSYDSIKKAMRGASDKTPVKNALLEVQIEQLNLQQLQDQRNEASLSSPIDGSVVYVTVANLGDSVDAYSTIVRIADESEKMVAYNKESSSVEFQVGMQASVTLESNGSTAQGEVVSTPQDLLQKTGASTSSTVYIKLPDEFLGKARVGEEARIVVIVAERKNVLKLPRNVVRTYIDRRYVQTLVNGVKVEADVQIGLETATECEIVSGLNEGDKVIVG